MGDVHHDAGDAKRVHVARLRLFFLLDGAHRLSAEAGAGARRVLAGDWRRSCCWEPGCCTLLARRWNRHDSAVGFYAGVLLAVGLAIAGAAALIAAPWFTGLDPTSHVYPATVWILVIWTAAQVFVGVIMQLYCLARRIAGRMTARYDSDISNVALYWHFTALTAAITVAVIAGFPLAT